MNCPVCNVSCIEHLRRCRYMWLWILIPALLTLLGFLVGQLMRG